MSKCKKCSAPVRWVVIPDRGAVALDVEPSEDGIYYIDGCSHSEPDLPDVARPALDAEGRDDLLAQHECA